MARVGGGLGAWALRRVMDGPHFTERALNAGDDVPDVLPILPDLGKKFIERRLFRAPIADHAGPYGKCRASPALAFGEAVTPQQGTTVGADTSVRSPRTSSSARLERSRSARRASAAHAARHRRRRNTSAPDTECRIVAPPATPQGRQRRMPSAV